LPVYIQTQEFTNSRRINEYYFHNPKYLCDTI